MSRLLNLFMYSILFTLELFLHIIILFYILKIIMSLCQRRIITINNFINLRILIIKTPTRL